MTSLILDTLGILVSLVIAAAIIGFLIKLFFLGLDRKRHEYMNEALEVQTLEALQKKERSFKITRITGVVAAVAAVARLILGEQSFFLNIISSDYRLIENFLGFFERERMPKLFEYWWVLPLFILVISLYMVIGSFVWLKKIRNEIQRRNNQTV